MTTLISGIGAPITASTTVNKIPGQTLLGIFVSAASATPTITVYDSNGTATTAPLIGTFTPVAGTFYPMYLGCSQGHYIVIGGTVTCTPIVG
jgi:hypothetical protein